MGAVMDYFIAGTVDEALDLLAEGAASAAPARPVAGGTDLAVQIADGVLFPSALVDIAGIGALREIEAGPDGLAVGSAVSIARVADSGLVPRCLMQGARAIGSPQIRNLGTIGGNVCNASPCGDTLAPLLALGARLELRSRGGVRVVDARDFFTGPKKTVLRADELLVKILIGKTDLEGHSAFRMIGKRNGQVISQVNVAVWIGRPAKGGKIADARVAFGSVAPTPLRLNGVEELLRGKKPDGRLRVRAEELLQEEMAPISDVRASKEYRYLVARALFRDALEEALGG